MVRLGEAVHVFRRQQHGQSIALWHALSMEILLVDQPAGLELLARLEKGIDGDEFTRISATPGELGDFAGRLRGMGFVADGLETMAELAAAVAERIEARKFIGICYLMLTDGCNMRCRYCFENVREPEDFRPRRMDQRTVELGIDAFARLCGRYRPPEGQIPKIQFYGGEPLLNFAAFEHATCYAERLKRDGVLDARVQLCAVSNGLCMTPAIADFIAGHGIAIGISIDGDESIHDRYRRNLSGQGTFAQALSGYRMLKSAGAAVGVSVTLTPEVIAQFDRVMDFLISDLGVESGLGFNILHHNPEIATGQPYHMAAAMCILRAFRVFRDRGVWEDRAMRKLVAFVEQTPLHGDCAAIGHQIVVAPDGAVGVCQDYIKNRGNFYAHVNQEFDPFDFEVFREWSRRSPLRMAECLACAALGLCGGGCPASAEANLGSIWQRDERACAHAMTMLEFLIWEACEQMG